MVQNRKQLCDPGSLGDEAWEGVSVCQSGDRAPFFLQLKRCGLLFNKKGWKAGQLGSFGSLRRFPRAAGHRQRADLRG